MNIRHRQVPIVFAVSQSMTLLVTCACGSVATNAIWGTSSTLVLATGLFLAATGPARADVVGRLSIVVKDADTGKPIPGAKVTLHDTAGVHGDSKLSLDATGKATTQPLETRAWDLKTTADGYVDDTRTVTVSADTTTLVEIELEPKEKTIKISANKTTVSKGKTSVSTQRNLVFIEKTPSGSGNPQSLGDLLITNPGMVQSTDNQIHPRGEHASTTIDIDGAELPDATIGRGGQFLSPEVLQSAEILTGAYAPEYGSEAAAVLNLNLRSGTIEPFESFSLQGGGFGTSDTGLVLGGQGGRSLEPGVDNGPRDFRYFVDMNYRSTDAALEPPQPDHQDSHNAGTSSTLLGHFDYIVSDKDQFSLTVNTTPAVTEVANRTGLSSHYAPVGQGYGYGGARDANGYLPGWSASSDGLSSTLGAYVPGVGTQATAGQDDYQVDNNTFGLINYRHTFDASTTALVSFSQTKSTTLLRNNNPANNILNLVNPDGTLTTTDNAIEFNPDMTRQYDQSQIQANLTKSKGKHTFKGGVIYDDQTGDESYLFVPQSQLALDALANIYGGAGVNPLLPEGSFNGNTDALGNGVWTMAQAGETFPTLKAHKTGYYSAAYLQDTWSASSRFTVNYGTRFDIFHQTNSISNTAGYSATNSLTSAELSPRVNTAYSLGPATILRLSYDKLFTQPPLAQGAIIGQVIRPEVIDQYEGSVEKAVAPRQTAKIDYYYKKIHNQDDTGILIPFTQIGALTTLNYQFASVHGVEFSYDVSPRGNIGLGGFFNYTYSVAKPGGLDEIGNPAPTINDHNQYDTVSTGVTYTWQSQAFASTTFYYGSGEASSVLGPVGPVGPDGAADLSNGGHTTARTQVDVRLASAPKMLGIAGLQLDVINLFDNRAVDNFNSGFSGTRFQLGTNVLLTMKSTF